MKGFENGKKTRRLSKEEFKRQLIDSIINTDIIETEELNEKDVKAEKSEMTAAMIKQHEKHDKNRITRCLLNMILNFLSNL